MTREEIAKEFGYNEAQVEMFLQLTEEQQQSQLRCHRICKWLSAEDDNQVITFKCKPTYAYQSIEFEYKCRVDCPEDFAKMEALYNTALDLMMRTAPEQPDSKKPVKKGPPATKRQLAYLDKLGIHYNKDITASDASKLITKATEDDEEDDYDIF